MNQRDNLQVKFRKVLFSLLNLSVRSLFGSSTALQTKTDVYCT
eukprot:UN11196